MSKKDKKILVTGASGFIGSHLVDLLLQEGYSVNAFCHYNGRRDCGALANFASRSPKNLQIYFGDVRDIGTLQQAIPTVDTIIHLAALIGIPYSYIAPKSYLDTNVNGTLNVLELAREYNVRRVVCTSTSEVYGSAQYTPIDERHPLVAQSPYSASKIASDQLALSFYRSYLLPVVLVRPFNTYGPRQSERAFIPAVISQMLNNKKTISVGDLSPVRDFNYVTDTCAALLALADCDEALGRTVNIATGRGYSMSTVLDYLVKELNWRGKICADPERFRPKNSEVYKLIGDSSLLFELTKYTPKVDFYDGLDKTINWMRTYSKSLNSSVSSYGI